MKEIACVSGVELLMDYLEGVLPGDVHAALDAHVAGCPRCAAFVMSYRNAIVRDLETGTDLETSLKAFLRAKTTAFKQL